MLDIKEVKKVKLIVFLSGDGTTFEAIYEASKKSNFVITAVFSDKQDAKGLQKACDFNLVNYCFDKTEGSKIEKKNFFEEKTLEALQSIDFDYLVLAGFMNILSDNFLQNIKQLILNVHPSLLPKYKGLHTYKRALEAGDKFTGSSIHLVTSDLDSGPVIMQTKVAIADTDSVESLTLRVKQKEQFLYPKVLSMLAENLIVIKKTGSSFEILFHDEILHEPILLC